MNESERFDGLDYEAFRQLAAAEDLSDHERVGFPDSYRAGRERAIFADIVAKLPAIGSEIDRPPGVVVDIGCGCGPLAAAIQASCAAAKQPLVLIDSAEMLARNPDTPNVEKIVARFPDCEGLIQRLHGTCAAVLAYSVLQYAFTDSGVFDFTDAACSLLAPGGRALFADVPNASMRRRFLASESGIRHHRESTGSSEAPAVHFNTSVRGEMDDSVVIAIVSRARAAGFHAWLVPQSEELPMANRREDILIARP